MNGSHTPRARNVRLVVLALFLVVLAAACGGSEPEVTLATPTPQPAGPANTPTPETGDAQAHIDAAADFYADGDYENAIAELEKVIGIEPDNVDAQSNLALAYFQNGDYESAAEAWGKVIGLDPNRVGAYYERGMALFNLKQYEAAIDDFSQVIAQDPTHAGAHRVRGKAFGFLENYEQAIADFSRTIELDPESDEAYLNRAVSTSKIGQSQDDLLGIIYDCGMVLQVSDEAGMRQQAQTMLENLLDNTDDPVLRQRATDALQGKVTAPDTSAGAETSLMDLDIHRPPGHSIAVETHLEPGSAHRFLFLASPDDTVGASLSTAADLRVSIQDASSGEVLATGPNDGSPLFVTIPQNALYHVVIQDAGGQGGDYVATFEASPKVSFALDPRFVLVGRLPQNGLLYYTFTGPGGATLQGNVVPHPETPVDLVVKVLDLETKALLFESNVSGPGQNEPFTYTLPDPGDDSLLTVIVTIEDMGRNEGAYILTTASDADMPSAGPLPTTSPESVVQVIFDVAQSGDWASLQSLCDPRGENDGDTQSICDLATDDSHRQEFIEYFGAGTIDGEVRIEPDGTRAHVPFLFGPDGDQEETMVLVNRDGEWYLLEF